MKAIALRHWPLRRKTLAILLLASTAALLITGAAAMVYETSVYRAKAETAARQAVDLLASTLAADLAFADPSSAAESLQVLAETNALRRACLYAGDGALFAAFAAGDCEAESPPAPVSVYRDNLLAPGSLVVTWLLWSDGERMGHLVLERELPSIWSRMAQYKLMVAAVAFALLAASVILGAALEEHVSKPIRGLARAARRVRDGEDFSVRVERHGADEIGELTTAFNDMLAAIEHREAALVDAARHHEALQEQLLQAQKMESIGRLAGGVAHDFNNFLTVIVGSTEIALMQLPEDDPLRPFLENARRASDQASDLTRRLLAFARKQIIQPRAVDPSRLLLDVEGMLRGLLEDHIELAVVPHRDVGAVRADPNQLIQVLMNLAVNARDAMPAGGELTIEARNVVLAEEDADELEIAAGEWVRIDVRDSGEGMDEEVQRHLFEPFFTTKEQGKGTGLGLAMCYGTVKQSGGQIRVESAVGAGTTVEIYLPRTTAELDEAAVSAARAALPAGEETVMVVEDNALVRRTAVDILRGRGYTVLEAAGGPDALRLFEERESDVDLLLTDVVMPQMSGVELAEVLRERKPGLSVIYVSGYSDVVAPDGELRPGIELLHKPYTSESLARRVRLVLDGAAADPSRDGSSGSIGGWRRDYEAQEGGEP